MVPLINAVRLNSAQLRVHPSCFWDRARLNTPSRDLLAVVRNRSRVHATTPSHPGQQPARRTGVVVPCRLLYGLIVTTGPWLRGSVAHYRHKGRLAQTSPASGGGATDGKPAQFQGRLAHPDGYPLA